jgi:hypothetical protein
MKNSGTIQEIDYTPGSGIVSIVVLTRSGDIETVRADAGPFFRALDASGTRIGSVISYEMTDYGTMSHFTLED